jgi:fructose-bisphosphate aldolase class I
MMNTGDLKQKQLEKMELAPGFVAALDQSGGSTPKALAAYGIPDTAWSTPAEMFQLVHQMRARIITSPAFTGERVLAAILFENTMDGAISGRPTADYLWNVKSVVPFLKVDAGLAEEQEGVCLMKPIPQLPTLLEKARKNGIFGTKMRSLINSSNPDGIRNIVRQQFEFATPIIDAGLVPIIEPEVSIHCPNKDQAEELLKAALIAKLEKLPDGQSVFLKLTLPARDDFYADLVRHRKVIRVLALSGGYSRAEGDRLLRKNHGVVASYSRALLQDLSIHQSEKEFNEALNEAIQSIYDASVNKD